MFVNTVSKEEVWKQTEVNIFSLFHFHELSTEGVLSFLFFLAFLAVWHKDVMLLSVDGQNAVKTKVRTSHFKTARSYDLFRNPLHLH